MDKITTTNYYTGRTHEWVVLSRSKGGNKITVERPDWVTGVMVLWRQKTTGLYFNEYASEIHRPGDVRRTVY